MRRHRLYWEGLYRAVVRRREDCVWIRDLVPSVPAQFVST